MMDISAIITKAIAEFPNDEPRRYIGASSIGKKCNRAIWYGFHGAESSAIPPSLRTTFDVGKRLEGLVLDYMEQAGLSVVRPSPGNSYLFYQDSESPIFQGHADGLLILPHSASVILEIKTAKSSSFSQFKKHGLKQWQETYYAQLQSYMGMSGYERAVLVAINKDSSELHHEWVDYDDVYYHELRCKAVAIAGAEDAPPKINNSPLFILCNRCSFKGVCHG